PGFGIRRLRGAAAALENHLLVASEPPSSRAEPPSFAGRNALSRTALISSSIASRSLLKDSSRCRTSPDDPHAAPREDVLRVPRFPLADACGNTRPVPRW